MSFKKFITELGDTISDGINAVVDGNYAGKAYKAVHDKVFRKVGKAAGDTVLKAGASGLETTANVVDHFRRNGDKYKAFGKKVGKDFIDETVELGRAATGVGVLLKKTGMVKKAPYNRSLIGYTASYPARALAIPIALGVGTIGAGKDYLTDRTGRNDGRTYRPTPSMQNPYELSQAIAYSQSGASYADNAGADPGLAAAIMRS